MNNTQTAVAIISSLLSLSVNVLGAIMRYNALINAARAEGREITDSELEAMRTENQRLTDDVLKKLE